MKRLSATVLSLLLVWVQVFAMAQPAGAAPTACRCCTCQQTDCCVSESSSAPQPLAAAPVQSVQLNLSLFTLTASPAWLLPRGEAEPASCSASLPLFAARISLFTRDCALLI